MKKANPLMSTWPSFLQPTFTREKRGFHDRS